MKVTTAVKIIDNALASYCENDIASDPVEQARTEQAWSTLRGAVEVARALVAPILRPQT